MENNIKIERPIGQDHTEIIYENGDRHIEISPSGSCINYQDQFGNWNKCDPYVVETLTGESGRSRSVFTNLPMTVGVRSDNISQDVVTLRLSNDPSKNSEISFTLFEIQDDDIIQDLNDGKYYVMEINISPHMATFCVVSGINLPQIITDYIVDKIKLKKGV